ncbi:MAG TPA: lysophospholipid acyltransferase family protein [Candidatus Acidoferrum sp.]|nr:lysophospholipid acyltransferase family protein [Candidatus Acidoferrum sp.]
MKEAALILFMRMLALLPLGWARALGKGCGWLCWVLNTRMAQTTQTNLALCFPTMTQTERERLAKASLSNTVQAIFEAGAVWLWPAAKTLALVTEVEGLGLLQTKLAMGKGVIVLGPHVGNWEVIGLYLGVCGCGPSSQLYQAPRAAPRVGKIIYDARSRSGAHMVNTDAKGVAELLKTLRRGEIVGILPDQVPPDSGGEFAPFFGHPALTMTLLNRLQQKTGAQVVMGYVQRIAGGFRIVFREPAEGILSDDLAVALAAMNKTVEMAAVAVPEQYQWEYKRFKRQPDGVLPPY